MLGALCWNCTSTVLCCYIWPYDTSTKSGPPAFPIFVPPEKPISRMQPRVLLYPTQSAPAAPLTAPNTKQVGQKSSTDFLFMFNPGWDEERRMIGVSCKITALWSKIQRSAMCQKAEWWQGLSRFWKQSPQSHTATTSVRKYSPTPYPFWMPSLVSAWKRAMNVVCHDKRALLDFHNSLSLWMPCPL